MPGKKWTPEEDQLLTDLKDVADENYILEQLPDRTMKAIRNRWSSLGLSRNVSDEDKRSISFLISY